MARRTQWVPIFLGSVGFAGIIPAAAQVAPTQLWALEAIQTESDLGLSVVGDPPALAVAAVNISDLDTEVNTATIVVAAVEAWGLEAALPKQELAAIQMAQAPAPPAYNVLINVPVVNLAVASDAVARRGSAPVEDYRRPERSGPALARHAGWIVGADLEIPAAREERVVPAPWSARSLAVSASAGGPAAPTGSVTVAAARLKNSAPSHSSDPMFIQDLGTAMVPTVPIDLAVATVAQQERGIADVRPNWSFAPAALAYEPGVAGGSLTVAVARLRSSPPPRNSDRMFNQNLGTRMVPRAKIDLAMTAAAPEQQWVGFGGAEIFSESNASQPIARLRAGLLAQAGRPVNSPSELMDLVLAPPVKITARTPIWRRPEESDM